MTSARVSAFRAFLMFACVFGVVVVARSELMMTAKEQVLGHGIAFASKAGVMAFDGFVPEQKDAFMGFSASASERCFSAIDALGRKLRVEVDGIDGIPSGGAVLVANHTFGCDAAFAVARIRMHTGRTVWSLGEHLWWRVPGLRRLAAALGVVDGTRENADALLRAGELVLVLPGGLRESMKPRELRYRLLWGHRYGFVHVALRNQAPLVPLACIGGDDVIGLVGNAYARARRFHLPIPLPRPSSPHRAALRFAVGEAIPTEGRAEDDANVRRIRREVEGALHELIEDELARRAGFVA